MSKVRFEHNVSLKPYNTFGLEAYAKFLSRITSENDLQECFDSSEFKTEKHFILGGGSNLLLVNNIDKLVLKNEIDFLKIITEDAQSIRISVGAGMNWHQLVQYTVQKNWGGLENLALIPGTVGASPIQNIGAYGSEVKQAIREVSGYDLNTKEFLVFSNNACEFGYRDSVFKRKYLQKFFITNVVFELVKEPSEFTIAYGAIQQELENMGVQKINIANIATAVINIRQSKLPNPKDLGNAGSFFKNPLIANEHYERLRKKYPSLVGHHSDNGVKIAAGWLIEHAGFKGKRNGEVGMHAKQALVLVNYGNATGAALLQHAREVQKCVFKQFDIHLEMEVNIIE
jgi:UDP-N-acetylmuramate dehydrogenase